mmetsp:Transcript_56190/g.134750  ORF Transcript_56190/g.134750 Transcript_56190/m.134750 type:complete len:234 (+) Transcript_56190:81-782(+)
MRIPVRGAESRSVVHRMVVVPFERVELSVRSRLGELREQQGHSLRVAVRKVDLLRRVVFDIEEEGGVLEDTVVWARFGVLLQAGLCARGGRGVGEQGCLPGGPLAGDGAVDELPVALDDGLIVVARAGGLSSTKDNAGARRPARPVKKASHAHAPVATRYLVAASELGDREEPVRKVNIAGERLPAHRARQRAARDEGRHAHATFEERALHPAQRPIVALDLLLDPVHLASIV